MLNLQEREECVAVLPFCKIHLLMISPPLPLAYTHTISFKIYNFVPELKSHLSKFQDQVHCFLIEKMITTKVNVRRPSLICDRAYPNFRNQVQLSAQTS